MCKQVSAGTGILELVKQTVT